jgi:5'-nucleotidase / UDP-sugar diphosphatase
VNGAPMAPDTVYKVAVNDYILGGGDGYAALGGGRIVTNQGGGNLVANDVMAYVEKAGMVKPAVEGRIKLLGK